MSNFAEIFVSGGISDIHDHIERWHNGEGKGLALHEYLGLTWDEYAHWVKTDKLPERLIDERQRGS